MAGIPVLILTLVVLYLGRLFVKYLNTLRSIRNTPGHRLLFGQDGILSFIYPSYIPYVSPGCCHFFVDKHSTFERAGWDITSLVCILPTPAATIVLADADVIKEVATHRARFPKPVEMYAPLSFYGSNIIASEGEEWKKYRKICAPAFSDRNNKLVWTESVKIVDSLFNDVWGDKDIISVDHCLDITLPIALFVIGVAGFGKPMSWKEDTNIRGGHTMSFTEALQISSTEVIWKCLLPAPLMLLTKRLRKINTAYKELGLYLTEMVREREASPNTERDDIFSNLLDAKDLDSGKLSESELIGNIYVFLLAGHETTAHTLCFTFALLALYPDEQENLHKHIKSIIPDGRLPTYEEMPLFTYSMAVFYETLRLLPPVVNIPKVSAEDTTLTAGNIHGEKLTIPVPKGTRMAIDVPGLHYNPRYWKDPHAFNPSRFLEDWPRDAFIPFSVGVRACLGRKFFETEGIAILTMFVSQYKITVKEEPQFAGETFEERKDRIFSLSNLLTLTPTRVPLVFTRRL